MFRLMVITDRQLSPRPLTETVRLALEGGADAVQLRERNIASCDLYDLAQELRRITSDAGASFIINHRLDIALAVGADGIQLGWQSMSPSAVHQFGKKKLLIGASCHNIEELMSAQAQNADYALLGPVFLTPSKKGILEPLGLEALKRLCRAVKIPVLAVGGINPLNVNEVRKTGITGIAVISAIITAPNPREAAEALSGH